MDAPRLEVFAMRLDDSYDEDDAFEADMAMGFMTMAIDGEDAIDRNRPWSVFINDGLRVCEIYNSKKADNFYTPLPRKRQRQHSVGILNNSKRRRMDSIEEEESNNDDDDDDDEEEGEEEDSACSGKSIDLPLTGPNADIVPWQFFKVIVHQDTGNPDDLQKATPFYLHGEPWKPSDLVSAYNFRGERSYDCHFPFKVRVPFGLLTLNMVGFLDSRMVVVEVNWLLDSKVNPATVSCIRGKISFCNSEHPMQSVLLDTPEKKAMEVAHGNYIRLMRYKVAVPICEFFTVEATLRDPITNSEVIGAVDFDFDKFSEKEEIRLTDEIVGIGAKIEVAVIMQTNDMSYLLSGH